MKETKVISLEERAQDEAKSYLEKLLSEGARKLLQRAFENEVVEYLETQKWSPDKARFFQLGVPTVNGKNAELSILYAGLNRRAVCSGPPFREVPGHARIVLMSTPERSKWTAHECRRQ